MRASKPSHPPDALDALPRMTNGGEVGRTSAALWASPYLHVGIIILLPVWLALANDTWMYSRVGWLDAWYYITYGLHYDTPTFLNDYYKSSRLPWILAEYLGRMSLSPLAANAALQFGSLAISTTAVYATLRATVGALPALIGASLLAVYPEFHHSGGADYHNTAAGPLYALTLLAATHLGRSPQSWQLPVLVGGLFALTVHTSVIFVNLLLVIVAHSVVTNRLSGMSAIPIARTFVLMLAGGIVVTIMLGLINLAVGRRFLFFTLGFQLAKDFVVDTSHHAQWWKPWSTHWYLDARYLGPLAAQIMVAAVTSLLAVARKNWAPQNVQAISFNVQFILLVMLWIFWQAMGHTALDWWYFAYPLVIPFAMSVAGAFAWLPGSEVLSRAWRPVVIVLVLSTVLPLVFADRLGALRSIVPRSTVASMLVFLVALLVVVFLGRRTAGLVSGIALLGIANATVAAFPEDYALSECRIRQRDTWRCSMLTIGFGEMTRAFTGPSHGLMRTKSPKGCGPATSIPKLGYSIASTGVEYIQSPFPMKSIEATRRHQSAATRAQLGRTSR